MNLSGIDYGMIALYFALVIGVGIAGSRLAKTQEDYLVAGRRLSFPLFFGCMGAMALGGASTVGSARLGYEYGFGGIWLNLSIGLGLICTGLLITSKLSRLRAVSVNEVVEQSYGRAAHAFSTVLTLIYTFTLSVVQVISIGSIVNGALGLDNTISMLLGGGIVIVYTFLGGMWSVTMTDVVQFVYQTIGVLILAPLCCLSAVGGWDALVSKVPETYTSVASMGFDRSFAYVVLYVPGLVIGQDIWQRIFTAKNQKIATVGTVGAGIYSILYALATVIIGMSVYVLLPELSDPQDAFAVGVTTFLPAGIRGIVLAAAMAAAMSVSSGTILASSAVMYNDLYLRYAKGRKVGSEIAVTRCIAAIIGLIVVACALWIDDLLVGVDICYGYLSGCVFVPLVASFALKRFSPRAGLASLAASSVAVTVGFFVFGVSNSLPIVIGMTVGLVAYAVVMAIDPVRKLSPLAHLEDEE